ncbi:MAG: cell division protein FtsZ, partial [Flavobacteriaceae bacterium]|nr:cell division protein FtsZ [Flavobacteriaceae bacterium]
MDENLDLGISFDLPKNQSNVIKAIGVGGGGSNAINHMYRQGIKGVDFVICNTDAQALNNSGVPNKIQLGVNLTEGLGAGANPEVGEKAALESAEDIMAMLNVNTKMVFITAGMGGGTGTGAAPIIAQMAREMNILTVGIVTTPFSFEGKIRNDQAQAGIEKFRHHVDSLIIINNNKLREVYGNLGFKAGFSKADEVLSTASKGIAEVITHHYTQNIDLKDAKTVLSNSGTAIMGAASSSGNNRANDAITKALDSPLLNDNRITGAKNVLLLIVSGNEEITIDEIGEINDYIQEQAGYGANIIMGVGEDSELLDAISVTVIATGFNVDQQNEISNTEPEKIVHELEGNNLFSHVSEINESDDKIDEEIEIENSDKIIHTLEDEVQNEMGLNNQLENENDLLNDINDPEEKIVHVLEEVEDDITLDIEDEISALKPIEKNLNDTYFEDSDKIKESDEEIQEFENDFEVETSSIEWSLFDEKENNIVSENNSQDIDIRQNEVNDEGENDEENEENHLFESVIEVESKMNSSEIETTTIEAIDESQNDDLQDGFNSSVSDLQKQRSAERRLRMKEFNYKFNKSKIDDIENEPAYKRRGVELENKNYSDENEISRTSITLD